MELIQTKTMSLQLRELLLEDIQGEAVAVDVFAANDQPPFPRSPLDGYALMAADSTGASIDNPVKLKVIGKVCAGEDKEFSLKKGTAVRIMTGAVIPEGADVVIRQEDTDYGENTVEIYQELKSYQNYCFRGEDYKKGELLISKGSVLDYTAVAVLASNGVSKVLVHPKPRVAILATGDELIEPGEPLKNAKIYDSNLAMLRARLREWGIQSTAMHVGDSKEAVELEMNHQLQTMDAVITTGGVSVGEKDIMNEVLTEMQTEILFDGIALKPGSPAKYALIQGKPVLALSGNPFAAAATLELLGRPMLAALMDNLQFNCKKITGRLKYAFEKSSPQRRFIRGKCENHQVEVSGANSSGQIYSMMGCNCLVEIPAGSGPLIADSEVTVWMLI